jgi:prepilin-type N-terminal cleavage/methylation domain-containing protein
MNHKNKGLVRQTCGGFTLMELLITLAIISLLVGLLLPALSVVRKAAREAKQRAQITTIELAISAFKNDYGDYPPSEWPGPPLPNNYCGSQKLSEALLGWDLMGFHPKSAWLADGTDGAGNSVYLTSDTNLRERKGPYLELATTNAFRLGNSSKGAGLFANTTPLAPEPYVICDVFGVKRITLPTGKTAIAGAPILYYKAKPSSKNLDNSTRNFYNLIYDVLDNADLLFVKEQEDRIKYGPTRIWNPLSDDSGGTFDNFYIYIRDPKVTIPWPYRPDSYILISAGADGFYGTPDDIRNFGD